MTSRKPLSPLAVIKGLRKTYPVYVSPLNWKSDWELVVCVILSAQCTDARVNLVTPPLFKALPTVNDFARVSQPRLEKLIFSTGFYHSKAKNLIAAAKAIVTKHSGKVPATMEELLAIPGIGRKSANVILHIIHKKTEGVVVDTHIFRVSRRTGVSAGSTPQQVERDIMESLPKKYWKEYGDLTIQHGRRVCHARKPDCAHCPLKKACPSSIT